MAVLRVYETFTGTGAEENERYQTEYDRTFDVVVSSLLDTPDQVLYAADPNTLLTIPNNGDMWLPSPLVPRIAICKGKGCRRQSDNPYQWNVTVRYSTEWQQKDPDPTKWPAKVRGEPVTYREAQAQGYRFFKDPDGNVTRVPDLTAILNSAGDPFDPGPEKDATRYRFTITRYEAQPPDKTCQPYFDTVNQTSWRNWDAGCCKYGGPSFDGPEYFSGNSCYLVTHVVDCRKLPASVLAARGVIGTEGWATWLIDAGYRELVSGLGLREVFDDSGRQLSSPALLDGQGNAQLRSRTGGVPPVPVYLGWAGYEMSDFTNELNLPG